MNGINNTNVNFTAKMDVRKFTKAGQNRMKNIAEAFEAKTKKYPDDTFEITDYGEGGVQIYHNDKGSNEHCTDITKQQWDSLLSQSDNFITGKLVKLFNIFKTEDHEYNRAGKYIASVIKNDKNDDPTDFQTKFWDLLVDKTQQDTKIAISKDPVLKDFHVY